ncbi:putative ribonuclease H protein [Nymphaea thermarum]|nr:putative ribonuclease H protein [Nymphaea thermarum]
MASFLAVVVCPGLVIGSELNQARTCFMEFGAFMDRTSIRSEDLSSDRKRGQTFRGQLGARKWVRPSEVCCKCHSREVACLPEVTYSVVVHQKSRTRESWRLASGDTRLEKVSPMSLQVEKVTRSQKSCRFEFLQFQKSLTGRHLTTLLLSGTGKPLDSLSSTWDFHYSREILRRTCEELITRVEKRLAAWKLCLLSYAGCLCLLKHVMQQTISFWSGTFRLPTGILRKLNQGIANCFWGDTGQKPRRHQIALNALCKPTSEGGIGLIKPEHNCRLLLARLGLLLYGQSLGSYSS